MKKTIHLLLVLILLSACATTQIEKKEQVVASGGSVSCFSPPGDAQSTEYKAQVVAAIPKVLEILKADYSNELKYEKIMAELPDSKAFDRLHYQLCAKYINGELTYEAYFGFTNQIVPVHRRWLQNRKTI